MDAVNASAQTCAAQGLPPAPQLLDRQAAALVRVLHRFTAASQDCSASLGSNISAALNASTASNLAGVCASVGERPPGSSLGRNAGAAVACPAMEQRHCLMEARLTCADLSWCARRPVRCCAPACGQLHLDQYVQPGAC